MTRISENMNVAYIVKGADHAAGVSGDSVNMGRMFRAMYIIQFFATITGDSVLTLSSGATNGTETTSETFRYRLADADQGTASGTLGSESDTYADWATSSSLTLTAATYDNRTLLVEIDSDDLTDGQPWLTMVFSSAASALNISVVMVGAPRRGANDPLTVL